MKSCCGKKPNVRIPCLTNSSPQATPGTLEGRNKTEGYSSVLCHCWDLEKKEPRDSQKACHKECRGAKTGPLHVRRATFGGRGT